MLGLVTSFKIITVVGVLIFSIPHSTPPIENLFQQFLELRIQCVVLSSPNEKYFLSFSILKNHKRSGYFFVSRTLT